MNREIDRPVCLHGDLNYWRIKVPKWTRDMESWETRDFDDTSTEEPAITADKVERITPATTMRPILRLEELDKFSPTVSRLRNLYSLIDNVHEADGVIVQLLTSAHKT